MIPDIHPFITSHRSIFRARMDEMKREKTRRVRNLLSLRLAEEERARAERQASRRVADQRSAPSEKTILRRAVADMTASQRRDYLTFLRAHYPAPEAVEKAMARQVRS